MIPVLMPGAALAAPPAGCDSHDGSHHCPAMGAHPMGMMPFGDPAGTGAEMFGGVNFTDEQQQAIADLKQSYRARGEELRARAEAIRNAFSAVSPDDAQYAAATEKASQETAALAGDVVTLMAQLRAEMHAILTAEQRAQLQERMQNRRERWESWRSRTRPAS
jgi:Spy/CpxP family protein refolding chaperone